MARTTVFSWKITDDAYGYLWTEETQGPCISNRITDQNKLAQIVGEISSWEEPEYASKFSELSNLVHENFGAYIRGDYSIYYNGDNGGKSFIMLTGKDGSNDGSNEDSFVNADLLEKLKKYIENEVDDASEKVIDDFNTFKAATTERIDSLGTNVEYQLENAMNEMTAATNTIIDGRIDEISNNVTDNVIQSLETEIPVRELQELVSGTWQHNIESFIAESTERNSQIIKGITQDVSIQNERIDGVIGGLQEESSETNEKIEELSKSINSLNEKIESQLILDSDSQNIFLAEYGITSYSMISAAIDDGKIVFMANYGSPIPLIHSSRRKHTFGYSNSPNTYRLYECGYDEIWEDLGEFILETVENKVTSISSGSTDLEYPSAKCVYDNLVANDKVFWAEYGVTTASEVEAALQDGKIVIVNETGAYYFYASKDINYYYFSRISGDILTSVRLKISDSTYSKNPNGSALQFANRLVTSLSSSSTDAQYPSAKCVYDNLVANDKIAIVTRGVTPLADVEAAIASGKMVFAMHDDGVLYPYVGRNSGAICFGLIYAGTGSSYFQINRSNGSWTSRSYKTIELDSRKVSAWQSTPDDTHYPSEKLVKDSIDAVDKVFVATYGATTAAEIDAAVAVGKVVVCFYSSKAYYLCYYNSASVAIQFNTIVDNTKYYIFVKREDSTWSNGSTSFELQSYRLNSIIGYETATNRYLSTKGVYDAIHPAVETTQPANGMLPNVMYNLGTLSGNTTFTLATPADANIVNHYYWTFDTPSTAPTITWPQAITDWNGGSAPTINASKHYEVSVLDGIGVIMEV